MLSFACFPSMGTTTSVAVEHPDALPVALDAVRAEIEEIDRTCSRFRTDSELSLLNRKAGTGPVLISPRFEEALAVALDTAVLTGGLVDPTVGGCLVSLGYTVTFTHLPADGPALMMAAQAVPGFESVRLNTAAHTVSLPAGVSIDVGASGKAWAADRSAAAAAARTGVGVAVDCGGDVAVAGPAPRGGWPVRIAESRDALEGWQDVHFFDGGIATSGTQTRNWRRGGRLLHHIIDPATGLPVQSPWRTVTVAGATCVEANAASTAAILLGERAIRWLEQRLLPARLVDTAGHVYRTDVWPAIA